MLQAGPQSAAHGLREFHLDDQGNGGCILWEEHMDHLLRLKDTLIGKTKEI